MKKRNVFYLTASMIDGTPISHSLRRVREGRAAYAWPAIGRLSGPTDRRGDSPLEWFEAAH